MQKEEIEVFIEDEDDRITIMVPPEFKQYQRFKISLEDCWVLIAKLRRSASLAQTARRHREADDIPY